jgi:nucleoside 2-deoxyribosyltransferase
MKLYVTARFKGNENKHDIEALCDAVHQAGIEDFCFIRDVENYQKTFDDPKQLWERSLLEIQRCDGLLIDVSDAPTGGRVIEAGIAYGLGIPIVVVVQSGVSYKQLYDGIAKKVIEYKNYSDITNLLKVYLYEKDN